MKPSCERFQNLLITARDGEPIPDTERKAFETHLRECPECRNFRKDLQQIFRDMTEEHLPSLPDTFFTELREDILEGLSNMESAPMWKRVLQALRQPVTGRKILVPVLSCLCGILIGFALARVWFTNPASPRTGSAASRQAAAIETAPTSETAALLDAAGDLVDPVELMETLNEQDAQTLINRWAGELPRPLSEDLGNGTG